MTINTVVGDEERSLTGPRQCGEKLDFVDLCTYRHIRDLKKRRQRFLGNVFAQNQVNCSRVKIARKQSDQNSRLRLKAEYCHRVSIEQIRRHVPQTIPEVKNISKSTIRRLLPPPQKNRKAASRYTGLVKAKVPPKRNDLIVNEHKDFHSLVPKLTISANFQRCLLMKQ